jgi:transcriptional regulator with XRE-family HTH domain
MGIYEAVVKRLKSLCAENNITPNGLGYISGVPQSTIKSIMNGESQNPGIVTIKKLCDGFDISIIEFFNSPLFDNLEQEIK